MWRNDQVSLFEPCKPQPIGALRSCEPLPDIDFVVPYTELRPPNRIPVPTSEGYLGSVATTAASIGSAAWHSLS